MLPPGPWGRSISLRTVVSLPRHDGVLSEPGAYGYGALRRPRKHVGPNGVARPTGALWERGRPPETVFGNVRCKRKRSRHPFGPTEPWFHPLPFRKSDRFS